MSGEDIITILICLAATAYVGKMVVASVKKALSPKGQGGCGGCGGCGSETPASQDRQDRQDRQDSELVTLKQR